MQSTRGRGHLLLSFACIHQSHLNIHRIKHTAAGRHQHSQQKNTTHARAKKKKITINIYRRSLRKSHPRSSSHRVKARRHEKYTPPQQIATTHPAPARPPARPPNQRASEKKCAITLVHANTCLHTYVKLGLFFNVRSRRSSG